MCTYISRSVGDRQPLDFYWKGWRLRWANARSLVPPLPIQLLNTIFFVAFAALFTVLMHSFPGWFILINIILHAWTWHAHYVNAQQPCKICTHKARQVRVARSASEWFAPWVSAVEKNGENTAPRLSPQTQHPSSGRLSLNLTKMEDVLSQKLMLIGKRAPRRNSPPNVILVTQ